MAPGKVGSGRERVSSIAKGTAGTESRESSGYGSHVLRERHTVGVAPSRWFKSRAAAGRGSRALKAFQWYHGVQAA
jgi:hypothetical protein